MESYSGREEEKEEKGGAEGGLKKGEEAGKKGLGRHERKIAGKGRLSEEGRKIKGKRAGEGGKLSRRLQNKKEKEKKRANVKIIGSIFNFIVVGL